MSELTEDETLDLIEALVSGNATEADIATAYLMSSQLPDEEALSVDPFQGDFEETSVLSDKLVKARKLYRDHWTGLTITVGERHRCLRERGEDGLITTRHSMLSLWLMSHDEDPSGLPFASAGRSLLNQEKDEQ